MLIPVLMYYWKMSNGKYRVINPNNLGSPSQSTEKDLFQYNYNDYVDSLKPQANEATVIKYLDALLNGYTRDESYNAPTITTLDEKHAYKYGNLDYDNDGQFFIADTRKQVEKATTQF